MQFKKRRLQAAGFKEKVEQTSVDEIRDESYSAESGKITASTDPKNPFRCDSPFSAVISACISSSPISPYFAIPLSTSFQSSFIPFFDIWKG
jgi:hypothetical protein